MEPIIGPPRAAAISSMATRGPGHSSGGGSRSPPRSLACRTPAPLPLSGRRMQVAPVVRIPYPTPDRPWSIIARLRGPIYNMRFCACAFIFFAPRDRAVCGRPHSSSSSPHHVCTQTPRVHRRPRSGVRVCPFVLGLRGPRFSASSDRRVRSFSSSYVTRGFDFPDVISFFSRASVRLTALLSAGVNVCSMSSMASILPSRSAATERCRPGTGAGEGRMVSILLGRRSATTVSLSSAA